MKSYHKWLSLVICFVLFFDTPLSILASSRSVDTSVYQAEAQWAAYEDFGVSSKYQPLTVAEAQKVLDTLYAQAGIMPQNTVNNPEVPKNDNISEAILPANLSGNIPSNSVMSAVDGTNWQVGGTAYLPLGKLIRQGPGIHFAAHTCVPEDNWAVKVIGGPVYADGYVWYDTSRYALDHLPASGTGWVAASNEVDVVDCATTVVVTPKDIIAPTIDLLQVYATLVNHGTTNNLAIQVRISDNIGIASVTITHDDITFDMTPVDVDSKGIGIYEAIFYDVSINAPFRFDITATDLSGNTTIAQYQYYNGQTNLLGLSHCFNKGECYTRGSQLASPDPVSTGLGNNVENIPVIAYAGSGGAAINFALTYNSQSTSKGYFGSGFSSLLDMSLGIFNNTLFKGIRVTYADGHSADFTKTGICTFEPTLTDVYDTLVCNDAGGYRLTTLYREVYDFDANGRLVALSDLNDNQQTVVYTGDLPTALVSDSGRQLEFVYDGSLITEIHGTGARTMLFNYTHARLDSMTDPMGGIWHFTYEERSVGLLVDGNGDVVDTNWYLLTSVTTPEGRTKNYQEYDENGRVTFQRIGETETYQYIYNADNSTSIIDANGYIITHQYDDGGRVTSVTDGRGSTEHYEYTNFVVTGYTDKNGNHWTYTIDDRGNRLTASGPKTYHEEWQYNQFNQVFFHRDAEERETFFIYDAHGNLIGIQDPNKNLAEIQNNDMGLPLQITDFSGRITTFTYNDAGDLLTQTNGVGDKTTYEYDAAGRRVKMILPKDEEFRYRYDKNDNLLEIDGPLDWSNQWKYDHDNNMTHFFDALTGDTAYTWDISNHLTQVCDPLVHCMEYAYEAMGHLQQVTDPLRRSISFEFNKNYEVTRINAPESVSIQMDYDRVGNEISQTDGERRVTQTVYDQLNRPTDIIQNYLPGQPDGTDTNVRTTYGYDLVGNITSVTDPENHTTILKHNNLDQLELVRDVAGREWHYSYTPTDDLLEAKNPRGYSTFFEYDPAGRLHKIIDAKQQTTLFDYDPNGNLSQTQDALHDITQFTYDDLNRRGSQIQNYVLNGSVNSETNVTTAFGYDLLGNLTSVKDARGFTATYGYNAASQLTGTVDRNGFPTILLRDKVGNLTGIIDANGHPTGYVYDDLDRLIQSINPEGHSQFFAYDKVSNTVSMTNERDFTETDTYDGLNRLISRVDRAGGVWDYAYDRVGNLLSMVDANRHTWQAVYNQVYNLMQTIDPIGIQRFYHYDANDNLDLYTDGNGFKTLYGYDELDQRIFTQDALQRHTQFAYDPVGNLVGQTAPDGILTTYDFDPLYRLAGVMENDKPTAAADVSTNVLTHYTYDPVGNLIAMTNADGNTTYFEYDGEGRTTREIDPLKNTWQYSYDPVGNLKKRIDANHDATQYSYYPDNQLKAVLYPDQTGLLYSYDQANNQTRMEMPGTGLGATTWVYDALDRVTQKQDALGQVLKYTYDGVGNRTSLGYPNGTAVTYGYLDNNWLQSVNIPTQGTTTYKRNNEGFITRLDDPNQTNTQMTYDAVNQLLSIRSAQSNGTLIDGVSYEYNLAGLRSKATYDYGWRQPGQVTVNYGYDPLRRLIWSADSEQVISAYLYDPVGNRTTWMTSDDPLTQRPRDGYTERFNYNAANQLVQSQRAYTDVGLPTLPATQPVPQAPVVDPTATLDPSITPTLTSTLTNTPTLDPSITPTLTLTPTPGSAPSLTPPTNTATLDPSIPPSITGTSTAAWTASAMPSVTNSPTAPSTAAPPNTNTATAAATWTYTPTPIPAATATAIPRPPSLEDLLLAVQTACTQGLLGSLCNPLEQRVEQAITDASNGDYGSVVNRLANFVNLLETQGGGQVDPTTAAVLIDLANNLIVYYTSLMANDTASEVAAKPQTSRILYNVMAGPAEPRGGHNENDYTATFQYDPNGSRTESQYQYDQGPTYGTEYSYDFERRLTGIQQFQVVAPGNSGGQGNGQGNGNGNGNANGRRQYRDVFDFTYDGEGSRLAESHANNANSRAFVTQFLNDGWDNIGTSETQNRHETYYYRGADQQIISSEDLWIGGNGADNWYHYDVLGSVMGLTRFQGQSIHNYRYDSYGVVTPMEGNFTEPHNIFTFTGQPYNSLTGLYYFGARYYDPLTAQWMTQDYFRGVLSIPGSLHRYGYVFGNPTNWTDLHGFIILPILVAIAAGTAIGLGITAIIYHMVNEKNNKPEQQAQQPLTPIPTPVPTATPAATPTSAPNPLCGTGGNQFGYGNYVIYQNEVRVGGSIAWRNNNPGNIRTGVFTSGHGAIGQSGGFAVFPNEETGMAALTSLLRTDRYQKLTVSDAMKIYAPPEDNNDPVAYANDIKRQTGVEPSREMSSLSDKELETMAAAIRQHEGWNEGTTYSREDNNNPPWVDTILNNKTP